MVTFLLYALTFDQVRTYFSARVCECVGTRAVNRVPALMICGDGEDAMMPYESPGWPCVRQRVQQLHKKNKHR